MKNISGKLNKVIDIYDCKEIVTNIGTRDTEYNPLQTVFAAVKQISGGRLSSEVFIAMQLQFREYYLFLIRNNMFIRIRMRIKYKNDFFEIKKIIEEDQIIRLITIKIIGD